MKIYCSCCDKVQPVRVDDCLDAKKNEPFQDIVCNECDLVIASGTGITKHPSLEEAVGAAYKTGWEHGKAKEREACAKVAGWLWQQFQDTKDAHERNTMEPFKWGQFGFDQSTVQQSKRMMDAIRARGQT